MLYTKEVSSNFHWIFYHVNTNKYLITNEDELQDGGLADLLNDGYHIVWDSALNKEIAKVHALDQIDSFLDWYQKDYPLDSLLLEQPKPLTLETVPLSFRQASEFVNEHHRHHGAPQGHRFSIGLSDGMNLIGVAIAGNPVSRHLNDGRTLEITRCCMRTNIYKNGVSKLISAVYQAAKALGYLRVVTYTLEDETGVSLRACGFALDGITEGGTWNSRARKRVDKAPIGPKKRWIKKIS